MTPCEFIQSKKSNIQYYYQLYFAQYVTQYKTWNYQLWLQHQYGVEQLIVVAQDALEHERWPLEIKSFNINGYFNSDEILKSWDLLGEIFETAISVLGISKSEIKKIFLQPESIKNNGIGTN